MKYLILLIGWQIGFAQDTLVDYFSDGDFTHHPEWKGDTAAFMVNASFQLQLNAEANQSPQQLYTNASIIDSAYWSFYAKMEFNPSGQNYLEVVLVNPDSAFSDSQKLSLELGRNQDKITIRTYNEEQTDVLSESPLPVFTQSLSEIWCKITHEQALWTIEYTLDSLNWNTLPPFYYPSQPTSSFGLICYYTATRKDKFFFDELYVSGYAFRDTVPPLLTQYSLTDSLTLILEFSEPIDSESIILNETLYLTNTLDSFTQINLLENNTIELYLSNLIYNTTYYVNLDGITDLHNNALLDTQCMFYQEHIYPYDLELTEIMIDPSPPVYLPEVEYIELHNRANYSINLNHCKLHIGEKQMELPAYKLEADKWIALYPNSAKELIDSTNLTLFLKSSFNLPNTTGHLALLDSNNQYIYALNYSDTWYNNTNKQDGGWSLNASLPNPCLQEINWKASTNINGGSPGSHEFELNIETDLNTLQPFCFASSDSSLDLQFPFSILTPNFKMLSNYSTGLEFDSIEQIDAFTLRFYFTEPLLKNNLYTLYLNNDLQPCFPINWQPLYFSRPSKPQTGQLKISEICFYTDAQHSEFIEYKNADINPVDIYDLALRIKKDTLESIIYCSNKHLILPKNYFLVFTKDLKKLQDKYPINPEAVYVEVDPWISLDNNQGEVALLDRSQQLINQGCYHSNWHSTSLTDTENISLEKIELDTDACNPNAWASAAETSNFATPGYPNSQSLSLLPSSNFMKSFSPNNDGFEDLWAYTAQFSSSENIIDVFIYDLQGYKRLTAANGLFAGTTHQFVWDGKDEHGELLPIGTYIFVLQNRSNQSIWKRAISITN